MANIDETSDRLAEVVCALIDEARADRTKSLIKQNIAAALRPYVAELLAPEPAPVRKEDIQKKLDEQDRVINPPLVGNGVRHLPLLKEAEIRQRIAEMDAKAAERGAAWQDFKRGMEAGRKISEPSSEDLRRAMAEAAERINRINSNRLLRVFDSGNTWRTS